VRLFVMSILMFVVASWLCGLAPNIGMLIAFRVLQGFVAGPMIPLSQTLLLASYPRAQGGHRDGDVGDDRARRAGRGAAPRRLDHRQHRLALDLLHQHPGRPRRGGDHLVDLPQPRPGPRKTRLDYVGLGLLIVWVGALQIMVDKGKELDWFNSTEIVVLAATAAIGFAFFLAWELTEKASGRRPAPVRAAQLPDGHRPRSRSPTASSSATSCCCRSGCSSTWATPRPGPGSATAPVGILAIILSPWVGKNVARIDPRKLATVAFIGFGFVLWMRSHFNTQADFETILIPTVLQGAAMAFFFIPLQAVIFSGLTPDRMPAAAGLSNFARITAGAVGTSIFTTAWENRAILHHAELAESVSAGQRRGHHGARPARARAATTRRSRSRRSTASSTSRRTRWRRTTCSCSRRRCSSCCSSSSGRPGRCTAPRPERAGRTDAFRGRETRRRITGLVPRFAGFVAGASPARRPVRTLTPGRHVADLPRETRAACLPRSCS
jgi:DHA2 family multidrug resistance protein